jgi:REP element-mobilizing transposase RayT
VEKRQGSRLPHWRLDRGVYFVTFRLFDSIPKDVVEQHKKDLEYRLEDERDRLGRELKPWEESEVRRKCIGRIERYLDSGQGCCLLSDPKVAEITRSLVTINDDAIVFAWVRMPNHVHAIVHTLPGADLSTVLQRWKSASAHKVNEALGRKGKLWQKESFDHVIRDPAKLEKFTNYVLDNPRKAGLDGWPWAGRFDPDLSTVAFPSW